MIAINAAKVSRLLNRGHLINLARNAIEKKEELRSSEGMRMARENKARTRKKFRHKVEILYLSLIN